jgi:acyl-CoA thioesterase
MSKLNLPSEIIDRLNSALEAPFAKLLAIKLVKAESGLCILNMEARKKLHRQDGIVHGGAVATLIDTAAAFAVLTFIELTENTVTVDFTIHFLSPIKSGLIEAKAGLLRAGRRIVTVAIEATDEEGNPIATAIATYIRQGHTADGHQSS